MKVENKKLDELIPYEKNAKKHDKTQINNVAESIRQYGFVQPIVVDKDGVIVIGHCRYEAAKVLGMKDVPCVCVDNITEEQVKALRIVDNKSNESPWDMDLLVQELEEIDLSVFDFDWNEIEICEPSIAEEVHLKDNNYQIIVDCDNENDAEEKYNIITGAGLECRISTL